MSLRVRQQYESKRQRDGMKNPDHTFPFQAPFQIPDQNPLIKTFCQLRDRMTTSVITAALAVVPRWRRLLLSNKVSMSLQFGEHPATFARRADDGRSAERTATMAKAAVCQTPHQDSSFCIFGLAAVVEATIHEFSFQNEPTHFHGLND